MQPLYSIGHGNATVEVLIDLLRRHAIEYLLDVRSAPYSRYVTHFNREPLQAAVEAAGIRYVFMGKQLGGRPECPECYDDAGVIDYDAVRRQPFFQQGIARVLRGMAEHRLAMMCSEEDPAQCHRFMLISRTLANRGVAVLHLRQDGSIETDDQVLLRKDGGQRLLFEDARVLAPKPRRLATKQEERGNIRRTWNDGRMTKPQRRSN